MDEIGEWFDQTRVDEAIKNLTQHGFEATW
jgi:hypothetical protein